MELPKEVITDFLALNRNNKFNVLLTIFATIISGFVITLGAIPEYLKNFSSFKIILLSVTIIAPIYLFNQLLSVFLILRLSNESIKKFCSFAKIELTAEESKALEKSIGELSSKVALKTVYNTPARQFAEIMTIIFSYFVALIGWQFNFSFLTIYIILFISSALSWFLIYRFLLVMISVFELSHLKPFVDKLKEDEKFVSRITATLDRIDAILEKKKEKSNCNIKK